MGIAEKAVSEFQRLQAAKPTDLANPMLSRSRMDSHYRGFCEKVFD
jgi:hypothetical protein